MHDEAVRPAHYPHARVKDRPTLAPEHYDVRPTTGIQQADWCSFTFGCF